jgi:hypothetical protein
MAVTLGAALALLYRARKKRVAPTLYPIPPKREVDSPSRLPHAPTTIVASASDNSGGYSDMYGYPDNHPLLPVIGSHRNQYQGSPHMAAPSYEYEAPAQPSQSFHPPDRQHSIAGEDYLDMYYDTISPTVHRSHTKVDSRLVSSGNSYR